VRFADLTVAFLLANNVLFCHFLGLSEMLGPVSFQKILRRSLTLSVILAVSSVLFWLFNWALLIPFQLTYLSTFFAVANVGAGYWLYVWIRRALGREGSWPDPREFLFHSLLLGGMLLAVGASRDLVEVVGVVLASVVGYSVGLVLLHAVLVRMSRERVPLLLQGIPFQLFTAGLVWLVLNGLDFRFTGQAG
jgi:Na+-translocating ferredoxin:NAD+ oxidoreductase RnfA subunit